MEILSPASNMNHIDVAIDAKANAVYGGVKKWNARNKAINFSNEEYNLLIDKLHKHNIKFYLTLNILMLDKEIDEVIDFLKNNRLPDSFIVADLGLIRVLHKEFPEVPLHFSTQFGAHNLDDVNYIESLNGERAILARELTKEEIEKVAKNSNIELECFAWGSQCLSFSGLCFFGTLINGGGGNRGKCLITCRDIYEVNKDLGHFLYVPDMDAINLISKMDKISCAKLEGRRRNPEEIRKILNEINKDIHIDNKKGYQFGLNIKDNNLYEKINTRVKPKMKALDLIDVTSDDICIRFKDDIPVEFSKDYKDPNVMYMYTEIKKNYDINKKNIWLDLKLDSDNHIKEVLLVNHKGDGHTFFEKENDYKKFNHKNLINKLEKYNDINLYKIRFIKNNNKDLLISKSLYDEIIKYIIKDTKSKKHKLYDNKVKLSEIYLETNKQEVIDKYINDPFVKIIYDIETINNLKEIDKVISKYNDKIIYKLPIFNWKGIDLSKYYKLLENKEVMFTRFTQIYLCKDIKFKRRLTDYTIYIWNKHTLKYLKENKIDMFTGSYELSFYTNKKIFGRNKYQLILGGKLPMVYTRGCFSHLYKCNCINNQKDTKNIKNMDKELNFDIYCNDDYRVLTNKERILNNYNKFKDLNNISFRYVSTRDDDSVIKEVIDNLKKDNYYDRLKALDSFKNSYECNLLEGKE